MALPQVRGSSAASAQELLGESSLIASDGAEVQRLRASATIAVTSLTVEPVCFHHPIRDSLDLRPMFLDEVPRFT